VLDLQRLSLSPGTSPTISTSRTLGWVQVWDTTTKSGQTSRFVVGTAAFSVSTDPHSTDQATHDRILVRAIARATSGR
jgi:phage terminase large subunit-like protein